MLDQIIQNIDFERLDPTYIKTLFVVIDGEEVAFQDQVLVRMLWVHRWNLEHRVELDAEKINEACWIYYNQLCEDARN